MFGVGKVFKISYAHQTCIYLIKHPVIQHYYSSVTWSFRNRSNDLLLKKHLFIITVEKMCAAEYFCRFFDEWKVQKNS